MAVLHLSFQFSFYLFLCLSFAFYSYSVSFSPIDNHLLSCGSSQNTTIDNRLFTGDSSSSDSHYLSSTRTIPLRNEDPSAIYSAIYDTARVFTRPTSYTFEIRERGTHTVRLHFDRFASSDFDLGNAQFHVLVDGYVALSNFSCETLGNPEIKEYLIWVDADKLLITFVPSRKSSFAFVNAIEVISAPRDLILETAQLVKYDKNEEFCGLNKQAFEIVYRVNVGGPKVTPFNDSLWRNWVPDDKFLKSSFGSSNLHFGGRIKYHKGGASREVCPDNVYTTARVISSTNSSIPNVNITWEFPVVGGYKYLVRLHFCDIASISLGLLYFNVYVNGHLAYYNLDLSSLTYSLASPFYADFVIDVGNAGALNVSVGPSNTSLPNAIDGILNGVEVMKLNNSMASLDGNLTVGMVLKIWQRRNAGCLPPLIAVVCFVLVISMLLRRTLKKVRARDSVAWTKLPVDVSDISMTRDNTMKSVKP